MMRRLNGIGYEALIRKELRELPTTTTALYELLLSDCHKNRSPEDREVLRHLLSWLAYAKSKLSIGEAILLISIIEKENSVSIDEAFDGPLGRLLRISSSENGVDRGDDHSQSETDTPDGDGDLEDEASVTEEATNFVSFQERSLRAFFRQATDDPHGLRCNSTEARVITFRIVVAILALESEYNATELLFPPEKCSSALMRQAGLKQYVATWVFAHFLEIDTNKTSDEMAGVVLECLFNILNNKNGCLKLMEVAALHSGNSGILQGREADEDQVLAMIGSWAKRALSVPPGYLSVNTQEAFRSIASEPRKVFVVLARGHVNNWFNSSNVETALAAFQCAYHSLLKSKELPELQHISSLKGYFQTVDRTDQETTVESLLAVFNAFYDIEKTATSYLGIGMTMFGLNIYEDAVKQCDVGLGLAAAVSDNYRLGLLQCKGEALCKAGSLSEGESERTQYFREALEVSGLAIEVFFKLEQENALIEDDRVSITYTFAAHAHAAAVLGEFDLVLRSVQHAAKSAFFASDIDALKGIVATLSKANQGRKVIEVLQAIPKADLAGFFLQVNPKAQAAFQEAAQRSGLGQCLLGLYNAASKHLATNTPITLAHSVDIIKLHVVAALFARQVLHDTASAKSLLSEIVYSAHSYYYMIERAAYLLAEAQLEDFRLSADPHAKAAALEETRALHAHLTEIIGADFRSAEAPTTVVLGLMLKVMGPALEHADVLRKAFSACVVLLTDEIGYNDLPTLRHLSRVLACVTGLERDAQIAMTAQLYVLDHGVREGEFAERRRTENGGGGVGPASASAEQRPEPVMVDEMAEGLLEGAFFWCNGCDKTISDWAHGDAYMCVYCIDCDFCGECFAKKLAHEKGDTAPNWRVICPEGHHHVKAPVEGWKGVRDGILRIRDERIRFRDWLKDLEIKWDAYWDRYWATSLE